MIFIEITILFIFFLVPPILFLWGVFNNKDIAILIALIISITGFIYAIASSQRLQYKKSINIIKFKSVEKDLTEDYYIIDTNGNIIYPKYERRTRGETKFVEVTYGQKYLDFIIFDTKETILYVNPEEMKE